MYSTEGVLALGPLAAARKAGACALPVLVGSTCGRTALAAFISAAASDSGKPTRIRPPAPEYHEYPEYPEYPEYHE